VAAVISILGILCKRIQLLVGGYQINNITFPGLADNTPLTNAGAVLQQALPDLVYVPSPLEIGVIIGVLALGVGLILAGLRYLPLKPTDTDH
jgi:molybdopterin-containing oxidoreductase family membrane subunit